MPPDWDIGRIGDLLQRFLDLVLAELALACGIGGPDVVRAERLGDGEEPNVLGAAARRPCGGRDPLAHPREVLGDRVVQRQATS
jgi:hypothetical protein